MMGSMLNSNELQQYLPLAVLKLSPQDQKRSRLHVATVLTACGIETSLATLAPLLASSNVATVLTACGIETVRCRTYKILSLVATVLTACGIETSVIKH